MRMILNMSYFLIYQQKLNPLLTLHVSPYLLKMPMKKWQIISSIMFSFESISMNVLSRNFWTQLKLKTLQKVNRMQVESVHQIKKKTWQHGK